jgi:hypothetical protein
MDAPIPKWLKTGAEAKGLVAKEQHNTTGVPPPGQVDSDETLSKLPVWQRTSTTLAAKYVSPTAAATLAKSNTPGKALPRVEDHKKIFKEIDWHKHGFVYHFLREVVFWHHQSTNGRFNDKLGRFERWGVKSVLEWFYPSTYKAPNPHYKAWKEPYEKAPWSKTIDKTMVSRANFFRIKDRLIAMGLIEAHSHLWNDKTHLWIKPTEELCRIVFEPSCWEKVRGKYAYVPTKKKPRGLSAEPKNETSGMAQTGTLVPKTETSPDPMLTH